MKPIILIDNTLQNKSLKFHIHRLLLEVPAYKKINFFLEQSPTQKELKFNINFDRCYGSDKAYGEVFVNIEEPINKSNNELIFNYSSAHLGKINLKFNFISE